MVRILHVQSDSQGVAAAIPIPYVFTDSDVPKLVRTIAIHQ